ncbi:unnamed protein product [Polarella glacialis]|uniref:RING-type domain-containing protein n=1 Tax=Polarella glacialis TaxID=89957 RepID=A0A813L3T8_POLGL|nr:unnamed protein product [Polarella glacialis]
MEQVITSAGASSFVVAFTFLILFIRSKPRPPDEPSEQLISELIDQAKLIFPVLSVLEEPMCVICLEDVAPGDPARQLSCSHAFHAECIDSWWMSSLQKMTNLQVSCPTCRSSALPQPLGNSTLAATIPPEEEVDSTQAVSV